MKKCKLPPGVSKESLKKMSPRKSMAMQGKPTKNNVRGK